MRAAGCLASVCECFCWYSDVDVCELLAELECVKKKIDIPSSCRDVALSRLLWKETG